VALARMAIRNDDGMSDEPKRRHENGKSWTLAVLVAFVVLAAYFGARYATAHKILIVDGRTGLVEHVDHRHKISGRLAHRWIETFFWPAQQIDELIRVQPRGSTVKKQVQFTKGPSR
jgi:hypothetical protein